MSSIQPATIKELRELGFLHNTDAFAEATQYMKDRREGKIKSVKTQWNRLNESLTDGIEWNTFGVIGGRPGSGKTLAGQLISHKAHPLNPDQDFVSLDLQFEMLARVIAMRSISAASGKSLRQLASAGGYKVDDADMNAAFQCAQQNANSNIYYYETAGTVADIEKKIIKFIEVVKKPVIITYDHSLLTQKAGREEATAMLAALSVMLASIRKRFQTIILLLSQLNREVETPERLKEGSIGNFIKDSDIFGGDALLQNADLLISIHRPGKYGLKVFGPDRYIITPRDIVLQILKFRGGEPEMQFYRAEFERMNIHEAPPPPRSAAFSSSSMGTP